MPRHAIETGCVDWVLSPAEIGRELARLSGQPSLRSVAPPSPLTTLPDASTNGDEALLKRIFRRLRAAHGLDFIHYKRSTLRRRLQRRMTLRGIESLDEYATLIESDPGELATLHQDFLVRVTEFFRDPDSSEALRQHVFPALRDRPELEAADQDLGAGMCHRRRGVLGRDRAPGVHGRSPFAL